MLLFNRLPHPALLGLLALPALLAGPEARALHIGEHRRVTERAVEEFNLCMSGLVTPGLAETFVTENIDEDINLFRKWGSYSHFFHPKKNLTDLSRFDSSIRIIELEYAIEQNLAGSGFDLEQAFGDLGHAVHHFQDATTPSHVVPVRHSLFDGYEVAEVSDEDMPDFDVSQANCDAFKRRAQGDGFLKMLDETALATLDAVHSPLSATRSGRPAGLTWEAFWKEAAGPTFGDYGLLGDGFGQPELQAADGTVYRVSPGTYRNFKRAQLRLAIDVTRRALHWIAAKDWGTGR